MVSGFVGFGFWFAICLFCGVLRCVDWFGLIVVFGVCWIYYFGVFVGCVGCVNLCDWLYW